MEPEREKPDSPRAGAGRGGYSLTEMIVVVAIIAVMAVVIVPRMAVQRTGEGLKAAATQLTTALRVARREAIAEREVRALALDIYSIPARFVTMRETDPEDPEYNLASWVPVGQETALVNDIAVVAVLHNFPGPLDVTRTDDVDLDGVPMHNDGGAGGSTSPPDEPGYTDSSRIFNPSDTDNYVNAIYNLIRFQPTGTADRALIYLWNINESRSEIPNPTTAQALSNLPVLGVPPGLQINTLTDQRSFFNVPTAASTADSHYYTVVVNNITGSVTVYDYAWRGGWDRKKDGG